MVQAFSPVTCALVNCLEGSDVVVLLRFKPLFKPHPGTVSVVALQPGDYRAGEQDTWLTLWPRHREGGGQDESGPRLWLRIDKLAETRIDDCIQPVDPESPGFGLELPEMAGGGKACWRASPAW